MPPAPPAERRLRTYSVVRRRYKRARWAAAAGGMVVAALAVGVALVGLDARGSDPGAILYAAAGALILVAIVASWRLVEASWHRSQRFQRGENG